MDEQVIKRYKEDEEIMIRLFVQWCLKRELDPMAIYAEAYPYQPSNPALKRIVAEHEDEVDVATETLLEVLQLFGNDDLAFVVAETDERLRKQGR